MKIGWGAATAFGVVAWLDCSRGVNVSFLPMIAGLSDETFFEVVKLTAAACNAAGFKPSLPCVAIRHADGRELLRAVAPAKGLWWDIPEHLTADEKERVSSIRNLLDSVCREERPASAEEEQARVIGGQVLLNQLAEMGLGIFVGSYERNVGTADEAVWLPVRWVLCARLSERRVERENGVEVINGAVPRAGRRACNGTGAAAAPLAPAEAEGQKRRSQFVIGHNGDFCEIVFEGEEIRLKRTLGTRYVEYLLHRPGELVDALELESRLMAEKTTARGENSRQVAIDGRADAELRTALKVAEAEREIALEQENAAGVARLTNEIKALSKQLGGKRRVLGGEAEEGARSNVSKAIRAVRKRLDRQGGAAKRLGLHLRHISLGRRLMYTREDMKWG